MRKSFFLSVLALAAVVSCQKSEIVDSKYGNDEIGFETYVGRDAMTKASVANVTTLKTDAIGVYGFYAGTTENTQTNKANLLTNELLSYDQTKSKWSYENTQYWLNATDFYGFLAYAPYAENGTYSKVDGDASINLFTVALTENANPKVTYTVPSKLSNQIDLLYSNNKKIMHKDDVDLNFQHALARLTVTAQGPAESDIAFRIKKVAIEGKFINQDVLTLWDGTWAKSSVAANENTTYTFFNNAANEEALTTKVDYAAGDNYLMMIPVDLTAEGAANLIVEYTTFAGIESALVSKIIPISQEFSQGKAYAINLKFEADDDLAISFNVTVQAWKSESDTTTDETESEGNIDIEKSNPVEWADKE